MITITLTDSEIAMAAGVGIRRRLESQKDGRKNAHGFDGENVWDVDIEGACAELAVAKALNWYWDGSVNTFKRGDIGNVQVRCTAHPRGRLIVRQGDPDQDIYVLVVGTSPTFTIPGWIKGQEAKQKENWDAPAGRPGAWFVPIHKLKPLRVKSAEGITGRDEH